MAAALTRKAASPYALKYEYNYDGAGSQDITVTQAQMITDSAAGPLREALTNADTDGEWTALPDSAEISLSRPGCRGSPRPRPGCRARSPRRAP
jgi:hypothetical protein